MSVGISLAINGEKEGQLPFWLMNIPRNQWPSQCPEFLVNLSARDKRILSIPDDQYQRATWNEVQEYIRSLNLSLKEPRKCCWSISMKGTNRLDRFTRLPSDLRRYREYIYKLKQDYGEVVNFIIEKRLQWTEREPEDKNPFANPSTRSICYVFVISQLESHPLWYYNNWYKGKMTSKSCTMTGHMELTQISFIWLSGPSFNWKRSLPRVIWRRRWERRSRTISSGIFVGEFQGKMYALTIFNTWVHTRRY